MNIIYTYLFILMVEKIIYINDHSTTLLYNIFISVKYKNELLWFAYIAILHMLPDIRFLYGNTLFAYNNDIIMGISGGKSPQWSLKNLWHGEGGLFVQKEQKPIRLSKSNAMLKIFLVSLLSAAPATGFGDTLYWDIHICQCLTFLIYLKYK